MMGTTLMTIFTAVYDGRREALTDAAGFAWS
jgi:hypothetical protein